jgi:hypothetical protein
LSILACAAPLFAMGKSSSDEESQSDKTQNQNQDGKVIEVIGVVRLVGNVPFTEIVITDADGNDWFITAEDKEILMALQQQQVRVKGTAFYTDMILANNKKIGVRKTLKNIIILN